ncbi:transcription elongation factor GreA [bacterium]
MDEKTYLTKEGYENLKKELEHLKIVVRKEVTEEIKTAREQGDLSENAEYDAAKEKQARVEKKILTLEEKLSRASIINTEDMQHDEVCIGAKVSLNNLDDNTDVEYTLVDESEVDFAKGKISINSPVAQGLLGHKVNDEVVIDLGANTLRFKITNIDK